MHVPLCLINGTDSCFFIVDSKDQLAKQEGSGALDRSPESFPGSFGPVVKEDMSFKIFLFLALVAISFSRAD